MTLTVCIDCGRPSERARCPECRCRTNADVVKAGASRRGYDSRWRRLSVQARRAQPFCTDCGSREDLTADHLRWPARSLADVDVVCRPCNSKRGPARGAQAAAERRNSIPPAPGTSEHPTGRLPGSQAGGRTLPESAGDPGGKAFSALHTPGGYL